MTKDYTLLRPFDLEKAKAGEAFGFIECGDLKPREFIAGPDPSGAIIIKDDRGQFGVSHTHPYHMAPLAWVEGKPVYRGDELYHEGMGQSVVAESIADEFHIYAKFELDGMTTTAICALTWTPPKKTREVKLLGYKYNGQYFALEEGMPAMTFYERRTDLDRTVTVEE